MRRVRTTTLAAAAAVAALGLAGTSAASASPTHIDGTQAAGWTSAWTSAMQETDSLTNATNLSCRNISRVNVSGSSVRVHLSNAGVSTAVTFNAASVGIRTSGPQIQANSLRTLTFGGSSSVTIPAGGEVTSDAAQLTVTAGQDLAVTTYNQQSVPQFPNHVFGLVSHYCTTFNGTGGDQTQSLSGSTLTGITSNVPWVEGIDVGNSSSHTVVALGDSITDGVGTNVDAFATYPDDLATRMRNGSINVSVVNEGIGGNTIVTGGTGPTALTRFSHDVAAQAGVKAVIVMEGTNDIANGATASSVENGLDQLAADAHNAGLKIVVGTLLPRHNGIGWAGSNASTLDGIRDQVNAYIRTDKNFDAVVDFDQYLKNTNPNYPSANTPNYQEYLAANYDSGDHTHPNAAGYTEMASLFNINQLGQWAGQ